MKTLSTRRWFPRAFRFLDKVADLVRPAKAKRNAAQLRFLSLETRVVPATSIAMIDAVAYTGKTVAVRVTHDQTAGSVEGIVRWGDGTTVDFGSWSHTLSSKTFTHTYSSAGKFAVTTENKSSVVEDTEAVTVNANIPPSMPVDGGLGLEWGKSATPVGNNPDNASTGSVRYADGVVQLSFPDLNSAGYGMSWGHARSWTNGAGYDIGGDNGNGWVESNLPSLVQVNGTNTLALVIDGSNARTFDLTSTNTYTERYFGQNTLVYDTGTSQYALTTPDGVRYKFVNFTAAATASRGQFDSRTDPNGNVTSVYSRNTAGDVTEIRRASGAESWLYDYVSGGDNDGRLSKVTLRRGSAGTYTDVQRVEYAYYGASEDNGNVGDLKTATIFNGSDTVSVSTQYYRYYKPGEADGFAGALKLYVGFSSYGRAAANLTVATATDAQLDDYADFYFQYDASRRVKLQRVQGLGCSMCSAGVGEYAFSYTQSTFAPGLNTWATKTVETLPDNNRTVVYSNAHGQVMLKATQQMAGASVVAEWPVYYRYDGEARLVSASATSAMSKDGSGNYYSDTRADLVDVDNSSITALDAAGTQIDSAATTGTQHNPRVARNASGDYVIVWGAWDEDGDGYGIFARMYDQYGVARGGQFRVNQTTAGNQLMQSVGMDAQGNFVVAWYDQSAQDVHARRYDYLGNAGSVFVVNATTSGNQGAPAVAMNASGQFVVAFSSPDGNGTGVFVRVFTADATAVTTDIAVNQYTTSTQGTPSAAIDASGDFAVAWSSYGQDKSGEGIYARQFTSAGSAVAGEFRVNTATAGKQYGSRLAMDAQGNFVVAWNDDGNDGDSYGVYFQRYKASGATQGSAVLANSAYTTDMQMLVSVAMDSDGDFAVTWSSYGQDGDQGGIYARTYRYDGTQAVASFLVNSFTTGAQWGSDVAADAEGHLVFVWGAENDIYARRYAVSGNAAYLADSAGLITNYEYGKGSVSVSAGGSSPGYVDGYVSEVSIKRGETGTAVKQATYQYFTITDSSIGVTVHPLANSTVYRNDNGTGGQTTSITYTMTGIRVDQTKTTHPTVTTAQNGPNSADEDYAAFDSYGRLRWTRDGGDFLNYFNYDDATGAIVRQVIDVDTSGNKGDYSTTYGAAPWSTPTGGGLRLITDYEVDSLGRTTKQTNPNGNVTHTVYKDTDHEVRVYGGWDGTNHKTTGPTQVYREDWGRAYAETLTMAATPSYNGTTHAPTGAESIGSVQSLTRNLFNAAGQSTATHSYFKLDDVTYSAATVTLSGPSSAIRHYEDLKDYAARGGVKRTENDNGTITRYHRDAMNRVTEVWVGTDDVPTSGYWSPTNNAGANMTKVESYEYDGGGVGDGNLTKGTQYPGGGEDNRVTAYHNDWRNRPVVVHNSALLYYFVYDNLTQVTETRQYDGGGVTVSLTNGVPNAPSASLLRAKMTSDFDDRGREYRSQIHEVDPVDGDIGRALSTDTWHDRRGNVIKTLEPGGLVTKDQYDGAGRLTAVSFTDGGGDPAAGASSNWSHADDVASDTVYESVHYTLDSNGNVTMTTRKQRTPSATDTGPLDDHDSQPYARVSYAGSYYDKADRLTAAVDVGTNGDATWAVPGSVPSRGTTYPVTVLVTEYTYDSAGLLYQVYDARNIESRRIYDALGRLTTLIEGYSDGVPSGNNDRKTTLTYDGSHHVITRTLWLDGSTFEKTEYVYNVVGGTDGNTITSKDLLSHILYPDPSTGTPTAAQYQYSYNALGEMIRMEDINGTVHEYHFDDMGRSTVDKVITFGNGIDQTVQLLFTEYNSAGRAFRFSSYAIQQFENQESPVNQVEREFNGFGQITREYQEADGAVDGNSLYVGYGYSGTGNRSLLESVNYPLNMGYDPEVVMTLDGIGRVTVVEGSSFGEIEAATYLGLDRVVTRSLGQGTLTEQISLDRFGRVSELLWEDDNTDPVEHFKYGYDANGNVHFRENVLNSNFDELYHANGDTNGYDLLDRMTHFYRGALTDESTTPDGVHDTVLSASLTKVYARDGVGNVTSITTDGGTPVSRSFDKQNRLISHDGDGLTFDDVGNLIEADDNLIVNDDDGVDTASDTLGYDAWNRLVAFNGDSDHYAYDALRRRTKQGDSRFFLDLNGNVVEERDGNGVKNQYVRSATDPENLVLRHEFVDWNIVASVFAITDVYYSVTAITTTEAEVIERFVYTPTGEMQILTESWSEPEYANSSRDWVVGWQGGRWDAETQLILTDNIAYSARLVIYCSEPPFWHGFFPPAPPPIKPLPDRRSVDCHKFVDALVKRAHEVWQANLVALLDSGRHLSELTGELIRAETEAEKQRIRAAMDRVTEERREINATIDMAKTIVNNERWMKENICNNPKALDSIEYWLNYLKGLLNDLLSKTLPSSGGPKK